jgi:ATP-dependent Clp protease ATP-binding subunit ClpA
MADGGGSKPAPDLQRVVHRAVIHVLKVSRHVLTGAELLVPIFGETQSPAARLLREHDMTRQDAVNFIIHGIAKGGGSLAGSQD